MVAGLLAFLVSVSLHFLSSYIGQDDEGIRTIGGLTCSPQDLLQWGKELKKEMESWTVTIIQSGRCIILL